MSFKDRYYGIEYYGVIQFYSIPSTADPIVYNPDFNTLIELRTKYGGLKKRWYYTQDKNNPIESISIEVTQKGCGICRIVFTDLMFPVDASDIIKLKFQGNTIYEGIVDNDVDITDPVLTASPFWKRFEELVFSQVFTTGTSVEDILEAVVTGLETDSGIGWNASKIDLYGTPPTLEVTYADVKASEILNSMLELAGEMHYWGVDTDRDFFVKRYDETVDPVYFFYAKDNADFEKIEITEDYSKVEMTEAVVYKKVSAGGEAVRVGQVGNYGNTTYPPLSIANKLRKKVDKITASEYLQDTTALQWAYEHLKKIAQLALTVKIDNIDIRKFIPTPDSVVLVENDFNKAMELAIDCNSVTGWTNTSLATGEGKDENDAQKLFYDGSTNSYYDFGRNIQFYKQQRIGFYIKAPFDTVIEVAFSENLTPGAGEWIKFAINDPSILSYYDFPYTDEFRYVHFKYVTGDIYIDDIQVFCETKRQVITTINKMSIKWSSDGIDCSAECGDITNLESKDLEKLNRKVKILEAINNI